MTKHQMVNAEVQINDLEKMKLIMSESEINEYVANNLARSLAGELLKNKIWDLTLSPGEDDGSMKFTLSLVVIRPNDYTELHNTIFTNDFRIIKNGKVIPLIELL